MPVSRASKSMATLLLASQIVGALYQGPIVIKQDGEILNLHVAATDSNLVTSSGDGSSITMRWGGEVRAFVIETRMADMSASNYHNFTLLGRELSYDIDLSKVGCSCNAALFFVSSVGYGKNGSAARGDNAPYYCDANNIGGVWCWEMDSVESNKWATQSTPHTCDAPDNGYISSCDRTGCDGDRTRLNSFSVDPGAMCPSSYCRIDTRHPFRIHQRYETDSTSTKLIGITNIIVQGSGALEWSVCPNALYLEQMSGPLSKMRMVFQLWGEVAGGMSWLDGKVGCSGACNTNNATVTFSNIEISPITPGAAAAAPVDDPLQDVQIGGNFELVPGVVLTLLVILAAVAVAAFVRHSMRRDPMAEPLILH